MDWTEIGLIVVGAFIGFGFSLLGAWIQRRWKTSDDQNRECRSELDSLVRSSEELRLQIMQTRSLERRSRPTFDLGDPTTERLLVGYSNVSRQAFDFWLRTQQLDESRLKQMCHKYNDAASAFYMRTPDEERLTAEQLATAATGIADEVTNALDRLQNSTPDRRRLRASEKTQCPPLKIPL